MKKKSKVFLAVYTHKCKSYCDAQFFSNLKRISAGVARICIVDNTEDLSYIHRLEGLCSQYEIKAEIYHLEIPNGEYRFQRAVLESVNYLRGLFIDSDEDFFVIVESDVMPPFNAIRRLVDVANFNPDYGIIGAVCYHGVHEFDSRGLVEEDCVFSGCSLYQRDLIENIAFSWDVKLSGCFPDSCMKYDAINAGWKVGNIHNVQCQHIK